MPEGTGNQGKSGILNSFLSIETELKHYLLKILVRKDDVEDILQDTFIRASEAEKNTHIRSHRPFLFKVARNLALTEITQNRRRVSYYIEDFEATEVIDSKSSVETTEMARQELRSFYTMLKETLPAQCRKVFILRKVYGFSHKEIAQKLGISVSTVEKHIINGMKRCDHFMTRKQPGPSNPKTLSGPAKSLVSIMEQQPG